MLPDILTYLYYIPPIFRYREEVKAVGPHFQVKGCLKACRVVSLFNNIYGCFSPTFTTSNFKRLPKIKLPPPPPPRAPSSISFDSVCERVQKYARTGGGGGLKDLKKLLTLIDPLITPFGLTQILFLRIAPHTNCQLAIFPILSNRLVT